MATAKALQFRVSIGIRSPLHAVLAPLQPSERPAALQRLSEVGLGPTGEPALAELRRIAGALEGLAGDGAALRDAVARLAAATGGGAWPPGV